MALMWDCELETKWVEVMDKMMAWKLEYEMAELWE
jgi:hypothetical protein